MFCSFLPTFRPSLAFNKWTDERQAWKFNLTIYALVLVPRLRLLLRIRHGGRETAQPGRQHELLTVHVVAKHSCIDEAASEECRLPCHLIKFSVGFRRPPMTAVPLNGVRTEWTAVANESKSSTDQARRNVASLLAQAAARTFIVDKQSVYYAAWIDNSLRWFDQSVQQLFNTYFIGNVHVQLAYFIVDQPSVLFSLSFVCRYSYLLLTMQILIKFSQTSLFVFFRFSVCSWLAAFVHD